MPAAGAALTLLGFGAWWMGLLYAVGFLSALLAMCLVSARPSIAGEQDGATSAACQERSAAAVLAWHGLVRMVAATAVLALGVTLLVPG